jgi:WD40 repeat protein
MESLTRRGFGLAGMGAALASSGAVRPAGASSLLNPLTSPRGTTYPGRVRLKQVASVDFRSQGDGFSWSVSTMAWSPDGSRLVAVNGLGNFLNVIDTATWRLLVRFRIMSAIGDRAFGFSASGRELIASKRVNPGSSENPPAFSVFEMDTGRIVRDSQLLPISIPELQGKPNDFTLQQRRNDQDLAVSPDGRFVFMSLGARVSGTYRKFAYVFDGLTGQLLASGQQGSWSRPTIAHDNRMVVKTSLIRNLDEYLRAPNNFWEELTIYGLPSLDKLLGFPAHIPGTKSLAWSPAGDRLATGANGLTHPREEESIRVWDAASGARLAGFVGKFEPVGDVAWHPSGRFFLSDSSKGTGARGSLIQLLPADGGTPLLQHFASNRVVISGSCFCPRTGRLAWHEEGQILIHEIQGL